MRRFLVILSLLLCGIVAAQVYLPHRRKAFQPVPAASTFVPSDVAGLVAWYDANSVVNFWDSGTPTNGMLVTNWVDKSASAMTVTNTAADQQPYWTNNVSYLAGKPWLQFDGVDDRLCQLRTTAYSEPQTVFIVARVNEGLATLVHYIDGRASSTRHTVSMATNILRIYAGTGPVYSVGSLGAVLNNFFLIEVTFDGTSSEIYTNGVANRVGASAGTHSRSGLVIGSYYGMDGAFLPGGIAEILIYDADLSSDNRTLVRSYFTGKYGTYTSW